MAPEMLSREGHSLAVDWWALGILIHEMLHGEPPFGYGGHDLPRRIVAGLPKEKTQTVTALGGDAPHRADNPPTAPSDTDGSTDGNCDRAIFLPIVRRLLDTDPRRRLGSAGRGADEVMSHPWFKTVDWARTAKSETEPPAFRRELGELDALDDQAAGAKDIDPDGMFDNF